MNIQRSIVNHFTFGTLQFLFCFIRHKHVFLFNKTGENFRQSVNGCMKYKGVLEVNGGVLKW